MSSASMVANSRLAIRQKDATDSVRIPLWSPKCAAQGHRRGHDISARPVWDMQCLLHACKAPTPSPETPAMIVMQAIRNICTHWLCSMLEFIAWNPVLIWMAPIPIDAQTATNVVSIARASIRSPRVPKTTLPRIG